MRMYIIFLLAPMLCGAEVPPTLLQSVFGTPPMLNTQLTQVVPVTPVNYFNITSIEADDMDSMDTYVPTEGSYDKFDLTLTKYVASRSTDNFLISPLGLKLAMAILSEAATSTTQAELDLVLDFDRNKTLVQKKFSRVLDSLQSKSAMYDLILGSRIYLGEPAYTSQRFRSIAKEFYKTDIVSIDFTKVAAAAADINDWVANNTLGKISNLVNDDDIAEATLFVINTLFFKGTWRYQFNPNETTNDVFYMTSSVTKETSFMTTRNTFYYADSQRLNAKILRLPYLGNKFAMYVVVPNTLTGVDAVFNDVIGLRSEMLKLRQYRVDVTLPLFDFQFTTQLDDILRDMGIRQAFEDTASFPGLSRGNHLSQRMKISKVLQKTGMQVNEVGTVAYVATEVAIVNKFGEDVSRKAEVIANRPFMFFIQDELTQQLLFMGRFMNPNISESILKPTKA